MASSIAPARPFDYTPPLGPIDYLHVDEDILIINKPAGLLSVPGKSNPDCLEARIRLDYVEALTVHRLDMATSGVMVFARNKNAQRHIGLQFEKRQLKKSYIAIVAGHISGERGTIDLPLICDWDRRPRQKVCQDTGKPAQTDWSVISRNPKYSRLNLFPKTGRSHQLRVHMLELGHPILGDRIYADDITFQSADRLLLHAQNLSFRHPSGGAWCSFSAPCPF